MIELEAGSRIAHYLAGPTDLPLLLAHSGATGLLAKQVEELGADWLDMDWEREANPF